MHATRNFFILLTIACLLFSAKSGGAQDIAAPAQQKISASTIAATPNLLLLEVTLDNYQLTDNLYAYESSNDILLPLGELANLLTIGISVDSHAKAASGFILEQERIFRLDTATSTVALQTGSLTYKHDQVRWIDEEIYVASRLLEAWLPIQFETNLNTLTLNVIPRERLPIQAKLDRERQAHGLRSRGSIYQDPGYPRLDRDYKLFSMPFIDQTLGVDVTRSEGENFVNSAYSAYLTGDLLGMEASMYLTSTKTEPDPDVRMTLARYDPDAGLLGSMRARSLVFGNFNTPTLANVMRGGSDGDGVMVSNRPLSQPGNYGLQTLRGELPPGWDVTLYFNDALVGFQQSRPDGLYLFEDQPLVYGTNEFVLVFNGPLGQTRVERQVFILDQTLTKPGEFFYQLSNQWIKDNQQRTSLQFDLGLSRYLAATGGFVSLPNLDDNISRQHNNLSYSNIGLRSSALGMLFNADFVNAEQGGSLYELGLKTAIRRFSLGYTHTALSEDFVSDFFPESSDPVRTRDRFTVTGSIPITELVRIPVALDSRSDLNYSGLRIYDTTGRISLNVLGTSFTNSINWRSDSLGERSTGALQISRRMAGIGISGQLAYDIKPESKMASYALTLDKNISDTSRLNLGVLHIVEPSLTAYTAGLTRNFGSFGLNVNTRYSTNHDIALGFQVFMAMGQEPRSGHWMTNWRAMAGSGGASTRVFLDENMNEIFDPGEETIENAGFLINESWRHQAQTDASGLAYLSHLQPRQHADIAVDTSTLEDPQWVPTTKGVRMLPRPGKVQTIDFPVVMTGEVDGTVYLVEADKSRGIGNALIELVNNKGEVVTSTRSASDGYYILSEVRPGEYQVRISPSQLKKFNLFDGVEQTIKMQPDGEFIYGVDFKLGRGGSQ